MLPQREVRVLHRQRRPLWDVAARAGDVGRHDVPREGCHREAVGADVVDHDRQDVLPRAEPQQFGAHRHGGGDVEPTGDQRRDPLRNAVRWYVDGVEARRGLGGRHHQLDRFAVPRREQGAQRLVALLHVRDRRGESVDVEVAGEADRERDVVAADSVSNWLMNHIRFWASDSGSGSGRSWGRNGGRAAASRCARETQRASSCAVGASNSARTPRSTPRAAPSRAITRVAMSELPPRSKKLSSTPMRSSPRTR